MCMHKCAWTRYPSPECLLSTIAISAPSFPFFIPPEKQLAWDSGTSVLQRDCRLCSEERLLFRCPTFKIDLHPHCSQYYGPSDHCVLLGPGSLSTHWPPDLTFAQLTSSSTQLPLWSYKIIKVMVYTFHWLPYPHLSILFSCSIFFTVIHSTCNHIYFYSFHLAIFSFPGSWGL